METALMAESIACTREYFTDAVLYKHDPRIQSPSVGVLNALLRKVQNHEPDLFDLILEIASTPIRKVYQASSWNPSRRGARWVVPFIWDVDIYRPIPRIAYCKSDCLPTRTEPIPYLEHYTFSESHRNALDIVAHTSLEE